VRGTKGFLKGEEGETEALSLLVLQGTFVHERNNGREGETNTLKLCWGFLELITGGTARKKKKKQKTKNNRKSKKKKQLGDP